MKMNSRMKTRMRGVVLTGIVVGFFLTPQLVAQVYLQEWDTVSYDEKTYIHMTATNGIESAIPTGAAWAYGNSIASAETVLKRVNLFDHKALFDSLAAAEVEGSDLRAADVLCWDVHARTRGIPLHELIGTKRQSAVLYGDARWRTNHTVESYARFVGNYARNSNLRAVKLHLPGTYPLEGKEDSNDYADFSISEIVAYLKAVREENPDLVLAYDPHPQKGAAREIDSVYAIMEACDTYDYTWIEAPLPPEEQYWPDYRKLRDMYQVRIQNEETRWSYEDFLSWAESGALDQFCPGRYVHMDFGLTPVLQMFQWVRDHPDSNLTVNGHYHSMEHMHLGFVMTDEQWPYFEGATRELRNPDGTMKPPYWPGIYDLPWLNPDSTAPSSPDNLQYSEISASAVILSWDPASDNKGIARYVVYRDDEPIDSTIDTSIEIGGLESETDYLFAVSAVDIRGNASAPNGQLSVRITGSSTRRQTSPLEASKTVLPFVHVGLLRTPYRGTIYDLTGRVIREGPHIKAETVDMAPIGTRVYIVADRLANPQQRSQK